MLKRITVLMAVFALFLAHGTARAFDVCDNYGIRYSFKAKKGEFLKGTASNLPCGGSALLVGSYKRLPDGYFFSIYVDQDPTQPQCCEGFELIGTWANSAGAGTWYGSQEVSGCTDSDPFTLVPCGAAPLRSEPPSFYPPGLRD